ncbi:parvulin-like peptidyl-prolyl cis-trans isomerase protein [Pseudoduganella lurida]|uniref:Parvulin-like peptidyl-prolyl cis-trans isomerase protein n=1 Tax=Pseudoduganella lurida TaxID=1036180 RepID=A0A562RCI5_9BURK|nr:peptidylprolyl isomerase [Pseudoduganella lurida]TWI66150.1 parvulin-like peptidyl-prolyl cis-trans isomerase protein [Pseudoduganella lurida]
MSFPALPLSLRGLAREPLLHFLLLGALIFGADWLHTRGADPAARIEVTEQVDTEAARLFAASMGRAPTVQERATLRQRWVDNEVLYREGLALRMDQGDPTIRERVIFKALSMIEAGLTLPPASDATLRAWFEGHRAAYDAPQRVDFLEAVMQGRPDPATAAQFAAALNGRGAASVESDLRVFKGRPRNSLELGYGAPFAASLVALPAGSWQVLRSSQGYHVVRLEGLHAGEPVRFEDVRGRVLQDWKDQTLQAMRTRAVRELGRKYTVQAPGVRS